MAINKIFYTLQDIKRLVDPKTFVLGHQYATLSHVQRIDWVHQHQNIVLNAQTQGSDRTLYQQHIRLSERAPKVSGTCTCPVAENCKHVVAVLLHALAERKKNTPVAAKGTDMDGLSSNRGTLPTEAINPRNASHRLLYVLHIIQSPDRKSTVAVTVHSVRAAAKGPINMSTAKSFSRSNYSYGPQSKYLRPIDHTILRALTFVENIPTDCGLGAGLEGKEGFAVLQEIIETKRGYWNNLQGPQLTLGEPQEGTLSWHPVANGMQCPMILIEKAPHLCIMPLSPTCYVDPMTGVIGPVTTALPPQLSTVFLKAPPIPSEQVERFTAELTKRFPALKIPTPKTLHHETRTDITPIPCLRLYTGVIYKETGDTQLSDVQVPLLDLSFAYDTHTIDWSTDTHQGDTPVSFIENQTLVTFTRNMTQEKKARDALSSLAHAETARHFDGRHLAGKTFVCDDENKTFFEKMCTTHELAETLETKGWRIDRKNFPFKLEQADEFLLELDEKSEKDWFSCDISTVIDGEKVNLIPLFVDFLKNIPVNTEEEFDTWIAKQESFVTNSSEDGCFLRFQTSKVAPFLRYLLTLIRADNFDDTALRFSRRNSPALAALESATSHVKWQGGMFLRQLGKKLRNFKTITAVLPPQSFLGSLRAYQQEGLNWLQFLREYNMNGILADDMGLGKTVQALAHICLEKEAGRLTSPCLIVAPTSVLPNWIAEARQFAPHLSVLSLQGTTRKESFADIPTHDIVLTSYPLLARDQDVLTQTPFHLVIMDEAQMIKNPLAKVSIAARALQANHCLCMTGTPMENHLGELWSIMTFLMPGFLGTEKLFRKSFRTPIEKHGDKEKHALLSQRVKPFILRRTKQDVLPDLPSKQVINVIIPLSKTQKTLYETVRMSVDKKVRAAIADQGLGRSHILVLDALLKLRQVCCDPRLLTKKPGDQQKDSAKLAHLITMITEMIEEGRKILLFSQFTSMLTLIAKELEDRNIKYVSLTGKTKNRGQPVEEFQSGDTPLFLISLKAGGSGLNLTAADTVIHYDPWWNPAVEEQATDRAYRIGQTKKVFVYKLLSEGTVEEKILALQEKKKSLTSVILDEHSGTTTALQASDLDALLAPFPH